MTPMVRCILWANVLVFALQVAFIPTINELCSLSYIGAEGFSPHQLVTYSFLHAGFFHLFFNMLIIVLFGMVLEHVVGAKRFLILYFTSVVIAAMAQMGVNMYEMYQLTGTAFPVIDEQNWVFGFPGVSEGFGGEVLGLYFSKTMGASGAAFGLLVAFAYLFPNEKLYFLLVPIPIKAKWLVLAYVGLEIYLTFSGGPSDNVAHVAHLGGGLVGLVLIWYWLRNNTIQRWRPIK
jgi:membrane associated rhomboid family serine protease